MTGVVKQKRYESVWDIFIINYLDEQWGGEKNDSVEEVFIELDSMIKDSGLEESLPRASTPSTSMLV